MSEGNGIDDLAGESRSALDDPEMLHKVSRSIENIRLKVTIAFGKAVAEESALDDLPGPLMDFAVQRAGLAGVVSTLFMVYDDEADRAWLEKSLGVVLPQAVEHVNLILKEGSTLDKRYKPSNGEATH